MAEHGRIAASMAEIQQQTWQKRSKHGMNQKRGGGSITYPHLHGMQGRNESSEWQDKWQQAVKELADVKERAWSLLEEKDLQLQSLKVILPCHCCLWVMKRCLQNCLRHALICWALLM